MFAPFLVFFSSGLCSGRRPADTKIVSIPNDVGRPLGVDEEKKRRRRKKKKEKEKEKGVEMKTGLGVDTK